jgi:PIN domain nuclease of toxin-antitoxin system
VRLLLDTQILVWLPAADPRLKASVAEHILADDSELFVSAVTACEFTDLRARGRISAPYSIAGLADQFEISVLDLPADLWADLAELPALHRDPVDRMLVSHARVADLRIVTADATIRGYPVETLW